MTGPEPLFAVVKGNPSDEETAALVVAVTAVVARGSAGHHRGHGTGVTSNWASHARALGVPPAPGTLSWRRSVLPR